MKAKIAILVIAAAVLVSFGTSKIASQDAKKAEQAAVASPIGGIGEDSK